MASTVIKNAREIATQHIPQKENIMNNDITINYEDELAEGQDRIFTREEELDFNYLILPDSGIFIGDTSLPGKKKKTWEEYWFDDKEYAVEVLMSHNAKGEEVFIDTGTMAVGCEKTPDGYAFIRNFLFDIDCGEGKYYASKFQAKKALLSFCKRTGLSIPAVVDFGNGIYAIWPLTSEIGLNTWSVSALKLERLVQAIEPGFDKKRVIINAFHLLYPIGSTNRSDPSNPMRVTLLRVCEPVDFETFTYALDKAIAALPDVAA